MTKRIATFIHDGTCKECGKVGRVRRVWIVEDDKIIDEENICDECLDEVSKELKALSEFILGFFWVICIGFPLDMLSYLPGKFGVFFKRYSDKERKFYNELFCENEYLDERPTKC